MSELTLSITPAAAQATAGLMAGASTLPPADAAATPFASVLQEQLAAQILVPLQAFVGLPAAEPAVDAPADSLMALLQGLPDPAALGVGALPTPTLPAMATAAEPGLAASDEPAAADLAAAVPLALAAATTPPAAVTGAAATEKVGAGDTVAGGGAMPNARHAANFAAATATPAANPAVAAGSAPAANEAAAVPGFDEALAAAGDGAARRAETMSPPLQAPRDATMPVRIDAPMGSRQWDGEFASRVTWIAGQQEQRANLVLTPPQFGRIEVALSVSGDQASAIFTSASPAVREAIEQALPRLREALLESGIALGQAQVGSESPRQPAGESENGDNRGHGPVASTAPQGAVAAALPGTAWLRGGNGLIDVFA